MTIIEMSEQMDVLYNNITSNQAPGLNEYEKSVFLTKAEKEIVKNHYSAQSPGNTLKLGFDDSAKRQADFSVLMKTAECEHIEHNSQNITQIDSRSELYKYPSDVFIPILESLYHINSTTSEDIYQIIPLRYDEYIRLMSKPYKRPLKHQVWRLLNSASIKAEDNTDEDYKGMELATRVVEIIAGPSSNGNKNMISDNTDAWKYIVRYVRVPKPIIVGNLDGLTIDGVGDVSEYCELDPIIHEDVVQRAVELAKAAWTASGQDNSQIAIQTGQRTE